MFCGTSEPTYINVGDETVLQKSCVIAPPLRNAIKTNAEPEHSAKTE